jgi:hydrogenase 3 maturation protease
VRDSVKELACQLAGKVVIVGIGNELRGDDGAGSELARRLVGKANVAVFDAKTLPENYLGAIERLRPDIVLIIDAGDFGGESGEVKVAGAGEIGGVQFSTHGPSLLPFVTFLHESTMAKVLLLLIQPQSVNIGDAMSEPVKETIGVLEQELQRIKAATAIHEEKHARKNISS